MKCAIDSVVPTICLLIVFSWSFGLAAAPPPGTEDVVGLQARLRAHFQREVAAATEEKIVLNPDGRSGLDLTLYLLREAFAERGHARTRKRLEAARRAARDAYRESGEFVRQQIRAYVVDLLNFYRVNDEPQRDLVDILSALSLWLPEDLGRLARLAGISTDRNGEYANEALTLAWANPDQVPDLVRAIRRAREVSDEQRALLILTSKITQRDAYALLWSMTNAYATFEAPRELPMFEDEDPLHLAVETLMTEYGRGDPVVGRAYAQVVGARDWKDDSNRARRLRHEFLDGFADGRLFDPPGPVVRRERNVIHLLFGCRNELTIRND